MKLLSHLWLSALSASRYPVTFGGMTCTASDGGLNTVGVVIKAFLRLLPTGAPDRGSSLPAAHFSTKTT